MSDVDITAVVPMKVDNGKETLYVAATNARSTTTSTTTATIQIITTTTTTGTTTTAGERTGFTVTIREE